MRRIRLQVYWRMTPMNAPIARDQLSLSLGNLTYIDSAYDEDAPASIVTGRKDGNIGWLSHLLSRVVEWQQRRAVIQEMTMMSDHELSDIGLSRADLGRIFDPSFAADHTRGRDYIAY
jgi:uncharacterized protein YjiS (DUF1127 family)